jgi:MFS family permease
MTVRSLLTILNNHFKPKPNITCIQVPIYGVAFVCTVATSLFADKFSNMRGPIIAAWLAFSMITSIIVCAVYNFTARYVLLVLMAAGLWASNSTSLSFASSTFGDMDPEVRAVALALMNALGNLAQIYGAYLFPDDDKPKYLMGFGVISGMLGVGVVTYVVMYVLVKRRERGMAA